LPRGWDITDDTEASHRVVRMRADESAQRQPETADHAGIAVEEPEEGSDISTTHPVVDSPTPNRPLCARTANPFASGFLLTIGGLTAFLFALALSSLSTVLIYVALALFAALGLDPAVRFLERRGLSRPLSVLAVILALVAALALVLIMIVPVVVEQITLFVKSVPDLITDFTQSDVYAVLEKQFGEQFEQLVADAQSFLTDGKTLTMIGGGALKVGGSIAARISGFIVVLVLTLYFVAGLPAITSAMLRFAPARDRDNARKITDQITMSVGGYVQGMVVLAFANAIVAFILYLVLGLPFPPLMATV